MRIEEAVKISESLIERDLKQSDAVAVWVLVQLAKKVLRFRRPLRDLADAMAPEAKLNQVSMFAEEPVDEQKE